MKRVIVIFSLVFVSLFGFSACDGESEFEEIKVDIEDIERPIDNDDDEKDNGPG